MIIQRNVRSAPTLFRTSARNKNIKWVVTVKIFLETLSQMITCSTINTISRLVPQIFKRTHTGKPFLYKIVCKIHLHLFLLHNYNITWTYYLNIWLRLRNRILPKHRQCTIPRKHHFQSILGSKRYCNSFNTSYWADVPPVTTFNFRRLQTNSLQIHFLDYGQRNSSTQRSIKTRPKIVYRSAYYSFWTLHLKVIF